MLFFFKLEAENKRIFEGDDQRLRLVCKLVFMEQ